MEYAPEGATEAERWAQVQEQSRLNDLRDLRGAEFLRLLRLAHSEGLLAELMQDAAAADFQADIRRLRLGALAAQEEREVQPKQSHLEGRDCRLVGFERRLQESSSQSDSSNVSMGERDISPSMIRVGASAVICAQVEFGAPEYWAQQIYMLMLEARGPTHAE